MFSFGLAVYFSLFGFFAWRKFSWALLFVVTTLPSYLVRFSLGVFSSTLLEGMILVLGAVWCVRYFRAGLVALPSKPFLAALGIFLAATTLAVFVSPDMRAAAGEWRAYFFEPMLFFAVLAHALRTREVSAAQIIRALSVSAILLSIFALFQEFTGFWIPYPWAEESGRRVTSIFEYPNALGLFLAPLIPLFAGRILVIYASQTATTRKLSAIGYWLLAIFTSLLAILWAHSTGALVGVAAGLIIFWLMLFLKQAVHIGRFEFSFYAAHFTLAIMLIAAAVWVFKTPTFRDELLMRDWSGQVRRTIWKESWQMLRDHPIFGAGLAGYQTEIVPYHRARYIEIFLFPHNILLNFWSEMGIPGVFGFLWLLILFFHMVWRSLRGAGSGIVRASIAAAMVVLLVHGLVDVPYFKNDLAVLFWIIYALGVV